MTISLRERSAALSESSTGLKKLAPPKSLIWSGPRRQQSLRSTDLAENFEIPMSGIHQPDGGVLQDSGFRSARISTKLWIEFGPRAGPRAYAPL